MLEITLSTIYRLKKTFNSFDQLQRFQQTYEP